MAFSGDIYIGKQGMTRKQYMEERGDKNGQPVDWKPSHSHAKPENREVK